MQAVEPGLPKTTAAPKLSGKPVHHFPRLIYIEAPILAISTTASDLRSGYSALLSHSVGAAGIGHAAGRYENFACSN
jgi:hypothetical protein